MKCIKNNNICLMPKKVVRKYWKTVYEPWTQPVATGDITPTSEGNIVFSASTCHRTRHIYGAMDGVSSGSNTYSMWLSYGSPSWWQVKFPYKILITALKHYNGWGDESVAITNGRYYTDSSKTTPIGNMFNMPNTDWMSYDVQGIPSSGILTDTIYFYKDSPSYSGIGELVITATRPKVVEATQDDYDYYTDETIYYGINQ